MKSLLAILFLFITSPLYAAIVFKSSSVSDGDASGFSYAHVTEADANMAIACITTVNNVTYSGVQYNSVAMTEVGTVLNPADVATRVSMYKLANPTVGSHTFEGTFSDTSHFAVTISTYSGVASVGTGSTQSLGGDTSTSINISSASGDLVVDCLGVKELPTITIGGGQSTVAEAVYTLSVAGPHTMSTTESGAGTITMSETFDGNYYYGHIAANLVQAVTTTVRHRRPIIQ